MTELQLAWWQPWLKTLHEQLPQIIHKDMFFAKQNKHFKKIAALPPLPRFFSRFQTQQLVKISTFSYSETKSLKACVQK